MSNPNKPQGFELSDSDGKQFRVRPYKKVSGTAIYRGQHVDLNADGLITAAAATGQFLGVAMEYKAAADTGDILICDDPDAVFVAMANGDSAQSDLGSNVDSTLGSPNTSLFVAGSSLDMSTTDTTSTLQWTIIGLEQRGENAFGSYARLLVKPNNTLFKAGVTGI